MTPHQGASNNSLPAFLWEGKNPVRFLYDKDKKNHSGNCIQGRR